MSIHIVCIVTSNSSWNIVNKLSGRSAESQCLNYENEHGNVVSGISLAKTLNNFYISITADLASLDISSLPAFYRPVMIYLVLDHGKSARNCQAIGPDDVPNVFGRPLP